MPSDETGRITDSRVLAAMAHPVRRRLLSLLKVDGPARASALAEQTGQAVGNISHHLRTLAAAGLIEEVPELARDRRERWWRRTASVLSWSPEDFGSDPVTEAVARAAESIELDYATDLARQFAQEPAEEKARWPSGPFSLSTWMRVTDSELAEVRAEMEAVVRRWADRELPDDGQDRGTILVFASGTPGRP
jgi:DNA-binding transcriptional ArsR family regulator